MLNRPKTVASETAPMSGLMNSTIPSATEIRPPRAHIARSPAVSPWPKAITTSTTPVTKAQAAIQMVRTRAVGPGHTSATTPAARDSSARSNQPTTGPARSLANARAASLNAAMKAKTANRTTNAPTVMPGQATATMPMTIASSPRHRRDAERDIAILPRRRSVRDGEQVVDGLHARGGPRRRDRGVVLVPGADLPAQRDRAVRAGDGELLGVELGVPGERLLDLLLDVARARRRVGEVDVVLDRDDSQQVAGNEVRLVALVLPVDRSGERDDTVLDPGVDAGRHQGVQHQRLQDVAAQVGVLTALLSHELHVDLVLDGHGPPDPLRRLLGLPLLAEAAHRSAQGHYAVVRAHRDRLGVDLRVPEQLVDDVGHQFLVVHGLPLDADHRRLR